VKFSVFFLSLRTKSRLNNSSRTKYNFFPKYYLEHPFVFENSLLRVSVRPDTPFLDLRTSPIGLLTDSHSSLLVAAFSTVPSDRHGLFHRVGVAC
jgi:hypothetical protein